MFLIVVRKGNVSINLCVYLYYLCDYSLQAPLYVKLYIYICTYFLHVLVSYLSVF